MAEIQTNRGEQQRKRYRQRDDQRTTHIAEKQEEDEDDKNDAFGQVTEDSVRGVVNQVTAIEKRNNLCSLGKDSAIQFSHLGFNAAERRIGVLPLLQQHDAFDNIGVVD